MKILVKANNWLGDAVMSLPTLQSLRTMYPTARVTVLTRDIFATLYEGVPYVDEVLPYGTARGPGRLIRGWALATALRKRKFDLAILLPRSFSSAMLARWAGIPRRIGYGRRILLTDALRRDRKSQEQHRVHYYHRLLSPLGALPELAPPRLDIPESARAWFRDQMEGTGPIVAINPGATYGSAKQWFPDRFAEVARRLADRYGTRLILIGGPGDVSVAQEVQKKIGSGLLLAGKTDILQLAAALSESNLLLTNDTGPMHVADAVGTPIVAVFGPTDPVTTPPFGSKHSLVRHEIECSPCLRRICPLGHHNCMKNITPEDVFASCEKWMNHA